MTTRLDDKNLQGKTKRLNCFDSEVLIPSINFSWNTRVRGWRSQSMQHWEPKQFGCKTGMYFLNECENIFLKIGIFCW